MPGVATTKHAQRPYQFTPVTLSREKMVRSAYGHTGGRGRRLAPPEDPSPREELAKLRLVDRRTFAWAALMKGAPMRAKILMLALALLLAAAVPASAKTISGTPHNDSLRGTNAADVLNGRAGNDVLRGLGGDDRLIGGKGNDRLYGNAGHDSYSCGAGRDQAFVDYDETVGADCETVHRAPPPELATPGHYAAPGNFLSFDVGTDGRTVMNFSVARVLVPCDSGLRLGISISATTTVPIRDDKTFSVEFDGPTLSAHLSATGAFDATGTASGSATIRASLGQIRCQGSLSWTASRS
jgi:hypothetical protein